ncbi:hypothetical protein R3P38DRAFT_3239325 [Favolaschia claudopus]|uniref:Reverse transcriptase zinc-binding domain-containing protein n=1 Tax=Favolaschia claudopus TaxID=2862362 RepID=A0AAV9Z8G6_9AGAR
MFTKTPRGTTAAAPAHVPQPPQPALANDTIRVSISGFGINQGQVDAKQGYDKVNGEIIAAISCLEDIAPDASIRIVVAQASVATVLIKNLSKWEDLGWVGVRNKSALQVLAARLRTRTGVTTFVKAANTTDSSALKAARSLAQQSLRNAPTPPALVNLSIPEKLKVKGAKLTSLTQATAYKTIRERKVTPPRPATDRNVRAVQLALNTINAAPPTSGDIWKSSRHKDLSKRVRTFLWMGLHGAHRIGAYWKHIPGFEDREKCQGCGEVESMEHILFHCNQPGRREIWELAEKLWKKEHDTWPEPSLGSVFGCCATQLEPESRYKPSGKNRLYRILISESAYLIWKLRNERVISRGGTPHSVPEIHNRWVHTLNNRLDTDRFQACHYDVKRNPNVSPALVIKTWSGVLFEESSLPRNWLREPQVLVGISALRAASPHDPG